MASKAKASPADEQVIRYQNFRRQEAQKAGLTEREAELFATGDQTLQLLWHLKDLKATPEQIASLVI